MTTRQIENRIKKIEELEAQKKALEEQISSLKAEVQKEMVDQESIETAHYLVRWTKLTSERFDSKTFKTEHADMFKQYVKSIESRRFSYSAK